MTILLWLLLIPGGVSWQIVGAVEKRIGPVIRGSGLVCSGLLTPMIGPSFSWSVSLKFRCILPTGLYGIFVVASVVR